MAVTERRSLAGAERGRRLVLSSGEEFKRGRTNSGLSQSAVAGAVGVDPSTAGSSGG